MPGFEELVDIKDVFENDEIVLMKARYNPGYEMVERTSVGVKDEKGDIVKIIDIDERYF